MTEKYCTRSWDNTLSDCLPLMTRAARHSDRDKYRSTVPRYGIGVAVLYEKSDICIKFSAGSGVDDILLRNIRGGVAQLVERSLCMREVPGSKPGVSICFAAAVVRFLNVWLTCKVAFDAKGG